jgi:hypothetical protein
MGQKPIEGSNPSLSARRFESIDRQLSGRVAEKGKWVREGDAGSEADGGPEAERGTSGRQTASNPSLSATDDFAQVRP